MTTVYGGAELLMRPALAEHTRLEAASSVAHAAEQLGYGYDRALELLDALGVTELCVFERRARRLEPIGPT
jgi:hypothetical protein